MRESKEINWFCVQLGWTYAKSWIIITNVEKMSSDRGIPSIRVIFRGVSRKISFLLWSIYDHMFSWTPCPENMKFGKLGEKTRVYKYYSQIPDYEPLTLLIFYVLIWRFISYVRFLFQYCSLVTRKGANPLFFWLSCSFHAHLGHTYNITWSKWPALQIDHGT